MNHKRICPGAVIAGAEPLIVGNTDAKAAPPALPRKTNWSEISSIEIRVLQALLNYFLLQFPPKLPRARRVPFMRRGLVLLLALIIVAILSFLRPAVGTVMQKPGTQTVNLTPASSPIYVRSPMSARQLPLVPASTSPQNAAILSPVPPPSPTSPTTFKNGVVISVTGTAGGIGFQNFVVEWTPGLDAASGWQTTGVTLAGAGATPVANGS